MGACGRSIRAQCPLRHARLDLIVAAPVEHGFRASADGLFSAFDFPASEATALTLAGILAGLVSIAGLASADTPAAYPAVGAFASGALAGARVALSIFRWKRKVLARKGAGARVRKRKLSAGIGRSGGGGMWCRRRSRRAADLRCLAMTCRKRDGQCERRQERTRRGRLHVRYCTRRQCPR